MSRRKTVYVHIGFDRTGTTSFQNYCVRNTKDLRRQGVLYPSIPSSFSTINHAPLTASYLPQGIPDDYYLRCPESDHAAVVSALKVAIDDPSAEAVLISSEHMSTRFRTPQIEALARDLSDYDCKIVVTVREHLARFFSSYAVHIMSGSEQTLDDYATMVFTDGNIYMRYARTIELWEAAFKRENLIVVDYQEDQDIVGHLLDRLGLTSASDANRETYNHNGSLNRIGTEALRSVNVALRSEYAALARQDYIEFRRLEYIRSHLYKQMRPAFSSHSGWRLRDDHRAILTEISEEDRAFLSDAIYARSPTDGGAVFHVGRHSRGNGGASRENTHAGSLQTTDASSSHCVAIRCVLRPRKHAPDQGWLTLEGALQSRGLPDRPTA